MDIPKKNKRSLGITIALIKQIVLMKKVTFTFPNSELLWSFNQKTKAYNIRINPVQNTFTAVFQPGEIEEAIKKYNANITRQYPSI